MAHGRGLCVACVFLVGIIPSPRPDVFFGSYFMPSEAGFSGWADYAALSCLVSDNSTMTKSSVVMN